jgi:hypothetical protein
MIDSEGGRCNTNVPFHLPDALKYKFLGCIQDLAVVISLNRFWAPVDDTVTTHSKTQVTSHKTIISHGWQVTESQWQCSVTLWLFSREKKDTHKQRFLFWGGRSTIGPEKEETRKGYIYNEPGAWALPIPRGSRARPTRQRGMERRWGRT